MNLDLAMMNNARIQMTYSIVVMIKYFTFELECLFTVFIISNNQWAS